MAAKSYKDKIKRNKIIQRSSELKTIAMTPQTIGAAFVPWMYTFIVNPRTSKLTPQLEEQEQQQQQQPDKNPYLRCLADYGAGTFAGLRSALFSPAAAFHHLKSVIAFATSAKWDTMTIGTRTQTQICE